MTVKCTYLGIIYSFGLWKVQLHSIKISPQARVNLAKTRGVLYLTKWSRRPKDWCYIPFSLPNFLPGSKTLHCLCVSPRYLVNYSNINVQAIVLVQGWRINHNENIGHPFFIVVPCTICTFYHTCIILFIMVDNIGS